MFGAKENGPEEQAALAVGMDKAATAEHEKQVKERNGKLQQFTKDETWFGAFLFSVWTKQA